MPVLNYRADGSSCIKQLPVNTIGPAAYFPHQASNCRPDYDCECATQDSAKMPSDDAGVTPWRLPASLCPDAVYWR